MRCPRCSKEIAPGLNTCPNCGVTRPPLPPAFARAEEAFLPLQAALRAARIDRATFQAELTRLYVRDEHGVTWSLSNDGRWHRYGDRGWVQADPPPAALEPRVVARYRRGRSKLRPLALGCGFLGVIVITLLALTAVLGYGEYQATPLLLEGASPSVAPPPPYTLSAEQGDLVARLGYPQSFTILFFGEAGEDVRLETWTYFAAGTEITFRNGELIGEVALAEPVGQLEPLPYRPDTFLAAMNLDQITAAAGLDRVLILPVEEALLEDAQVFLAEQLAFGLLDGGLVSVETLALEIE